MFRWVLLVQDEDADEVEEVNKCCVCSIWACFILGCFFKKVGPHAVAESGTTNDKGIKVHGMGHSICRTLSRDCEGHGIIGKTVMLPKRKSDATVSIHLLILYAGYDNELSCSSRT